MVWGGCAGAGGTVTVPAGAVVVAAGTVAAASVEGAEAAVPACYTIPLFVTSTRPTVVLSFGLM